MTEQIANHRAKEKPPQIEGAIEAVQPERFDCEATLGERFCGSLDGRARLWSSHAESVALENPDAQVAKLGFTVRAHGNGSGERVAGVRPGHYFEEGTHIGNGAGHGTDDADPGKSAGPRRKMSRGRNAAGRGLQPANSTEMRWDAN